MNIKHVLKLLHPRYQRLVLEYPVDMKPRYGHGSPPHPLLSKLIEAGRQTYSGYIDEMLRFTKVFHGIRTSTRESDENEPAWDNGYLPGLDIVALYTLIEHFKPATYVEIGSGNSTKVARKSVRDNRLTTRIISIDPFPRAQIDHLADRVVRQPLENIGDPTSLVRDLTANDILFIDNSHRCLPNSDVMVFFLELLPALRSGVVVQIHDIYLPYDYPQDMCDRFYSEQYMLAAYLLANPERYEILFPGIFVSEDIELSGRTAPIWSSENTSMVEQHGGSFWFRIR